MESGSRVEGPLQIICKAEGGSASTSSPTSPLSDAGTSDEKILVLHSPAGADKLSFTFNPPNADFVEILRLAVDEFDGLRQLLGDFGKNLDTLYGASFEDLKLVCKKFNKGASTISNLWKGATKPGTEIAPAKFLNRVINYCYNKAVDNEKSLNKHYEAFSSQTYGETSFQRMQLILEEVKPTCQDVFVDLGSGVGQLVIHVAGGSKVKKAFGIEIASLPARFAARLEEEFRKLMKFYGKKTRPFSLERGNFLDTQFRDLITQEATIIFINNFAFQADLDAMIKTTLLSELKTGTKIISTKPYVPLNCAVNERHLNDISAIIDVTEMKACPNPCSWTSNTVPYYLHVVNHGKLENYFNRRKNGISVERSATPSSSKTSNSRESSVGYKENPKKKKLNGTGRQQWSDSLSKASSIEDPLIDDKLDELADSPPSSDSESEFGRRRKKAKGKKTKKVTQKGKSVRADRNTLSNDAKEGIEMLHQMTCAVAEGRKVNGLFTGAKPAANSEKIILPLPNILPPRGSNKRNAKSGDAPSTASSKYPHLDMFLVELRRVYETFLDDIRTVEDQSKTALDSEVKDSAMSQDHNIGQILSRMDRIQRSCSDLYREVGDMKAEVLSLYNSRAGDANPLTCKRAKTDAPGGSGMSDAEQSKSLAQSKAINGLLLGMQHMRPPASSAEISQLPQPADFVANQCNGLSALMNSFPQGNAVENARQCLRQSAPINELEAFSAAFPQLLNPAAVSLLFGQASTASPDGTRYF